MRHAAAAAMIVACGLLTACTTQGEPTMTPMEARTALVALVEATMTASQATGWTPAVVHGDECTVGGRQGVTFGVTVGTQTVGDDPAADARRVAELWQSQGVSVRAVDQPTPRIFGEGGVTSAISFTTTPTVYVIDAGGACVPGDHLDYDNVPLPTDGTTPAPSAGGTGTP